MAYSVQVVINATSNIVRDASSNTWAFTAAGVESLTAAVDVLEGLYDELRFLYPSTVALGGHTLKAYDLTEPEPRAPVIERTWSFSSAPSGQPLPSECAMCLSFQGARISGAAQNGRRGRVFIGPLDTGVLDPSGRLSDAAAEGAAVVGAALLAASDAALDWTWGIHAPSQDGGFVAITDGWVDNAFDTQRRRGVLPTSRRTY